MRWRTQGSRSLLFVSTLMVLCLASLGVAQADPIVAGHTDMANTAGGGVDGTINWAVWAPTDYPGPAPTGGTGSGAFDTSTNFVYAYQVGNTGSNTSEIASVTVAFLALAASSITAWGAIHSFFTDVDGTVTAANSLTGAPASVGLTTGVGGDTVHKDPCNVTKGGSSVQAVYNDSCVAGPLVGGFIGNIPASSYSTVFLYQSSLGPGFFSGSIQDGGVGADGLVPSPAPEPGTLLLLGSGLVAMGAWGRRKLNRRKA